MLCSKTYKPLDLIIRKPRADGDMHAFISKLKLRPEQMSAKICDKKLAAQDHQEGLARTLNLHAFHNLGDKVTSSSLYNQIKPDDFNNLSASAKGRKLGE